MNRTTTNLLVCSRETIDCPSITDLFFQTEPTGPGPKKGIFPKLTLMGTPQNCTYKGSE